MIDRNACKEHLCGLLKYPTVSDIEESSMDFKAFEEMHGYMEAAYPLLHKTLKKKKIGKAGLLYCWPGGNGRGPKPLLLMAHQDVVPAGDLEKWHYPPFGGIADEKYIYGRGAIDCKGHLAAQLEGIEALIRDGFWPNYDLYLFYGYNEEIRGENVQSSAEEAARYLESQGLSFGMILDEGGGMKAAKQYGIPDGLCTVMLAEKGYADVEISCNCPGGHSSKPYKNGALKQIAEAILALEQHPWPYRITDTNKKRYERLAPYIRKVNVKLGTLLIDMEANWEKLKPFIDRDPEMAAMFHTTMVPTVVSGAKQANILPEKASVIVNCRLLEGDTLAALEAYIKSVIPKGLEVRLLNGNEASKVSLYEGSEKDLLVQVCRELYGGQIVEIPDLLLAGTDARHMYALSDRVYRFSPFFKREELPAAHSVNECLGITTLAEGAEFYYRMLKRYNRIQ